MSTMTKESHFQITITKECITPNVPRLRSSFFNRKFRDISGGSDGHTQLTPTTPKVVNTRTRSSTKSRSKRSAGSSSVGSNGTRKYSPSNVRPSRSRPNNDEFYDQDFSTPRATRSLLTPPKTTTRLNKNGRIAHLIYQPLELDNESSSESNERYLRLQRSQPKWVGAPTESSPLAIEAPHAEVTLTILGSDFTIYRKEQDNNVAIADSTMSNDISTDKAEDRPATTNKTKKIETIVISDSEDDIESTDTIRITKKLKSEPVNVPNSPLAKPYTMVLNTQHQSHPETPPDDDLGEKGVTITKPSKRFSTFVPGNCNLDDVLNLFDKQQSTLCSGNSQRGS